MSRPDPVRASLVDTCALDVHEAQGRVEPLPDLVEDQRTVPIEVGIQDPPAEGIALTHVCRLTNVSARLELAIGNGNL